MVTGTGGVATLLATRADVDVVPSSPHVPSGLGGAGPRPFAEEVHHQRPQADERHARYPKPLIV